MTHSLLEPFQYRLMDTPADFFISHTIANNPENGLNVGDAYQGFHVKSQCAGMAYCIRESGNSSGDVAAPGQAPALV